MTRTAPLTKVTLWGFRCCRCDYEWIPRGIEQVAGDAKAPEPPEDPPRVCPRCKSARWDTPRPVPKYLGEGGARTPPSTRAAKTPVKAAVKTPTRAAK